MSDWYTHLLKVITKFQPKDFDAIPRISEFYTNLLDYMMNPKIHTKSAVCVTKAFIDNNLF